MFEIIEINLLGSLTALRLLFVRTPGDSKI